MQLPSRGQLRTALGYVVTSATTALILLGVEAGSGQAVADWDFGIAWTGFGAGILGIVATIVWPEQVLRISGGNDGQFNFVGERDLGGIMAADKRVCWYTALAIQNRSAREATGCRVRISRIEPGYSFQGLPYTLRWHPGDTEEMDLQASGSGRVILAWAVENERYLETGAVVKGRAMGGPLAPENPEHDVTITVVAWPSGQAVSTKKFRISGFGDASRFFLDVQDA